MGVLETILARKRQEVAAIRRGGGPRVPGDEIAPVRGFRRTLVEDPGVSVIAEVKKASPSKGLLCPDFDPVVLAGDYVAGGAKAVSVLTDETFFQGSLEFLPRIRREITLPLLRKDFIIDHVQVEESAAWGADGILLIVAALDPSQLVELMAHARERGLDCLVEVHDEGEMEQAWKAGADLIGVNNRDLRDFTVSLETTLRVKRAAGHSVPLVSESGISGPDAMRTLREVGVTAALIGEGLVKARDRRAHLAALVGAGRP